MNIIEEYTYSTLDVPKKVTKRKENWGEIFFCYLENDKREADYKQKV